MEISFEEKFNNISHKVSYFVSELSLKHYKNASNIKYFGIKNITSEFIEVNVAIIYGFPISNDYAVMKIPRHMLETSEKIEELINTTLNQD